MSTAHVITVNAPIKGELNLAAIESVKQVKKDVKSTPKHKPESKSTAKIRLRCPAGSKQRRRNFFGLKTRSESDWSLQRKTLTEPREILEDRNWPHSHFEVWMEVRL